MSEVCFSPDEQLRPRGGHALQEEARAIQTRHETVGDARRAVRALRRRELLRLAFGAILGTLTIDDTSGRFIVEAKLPWPARQGESS